MVSIDQTFSKIKLIKHFLKSFCQKKNIV